MRRGEVWVVRRAGREHLVVIVGHDTLTDSRSGVLTVPLSDVRASTLIEPAVRLDDETPIGVVLTPRVGEITKEYLAEVRGQLHKESIGTLDIALRAALDL